MSDGVPEISQGGMLAGIDQLRLPTLVDRHGAAAACGRLD